MLFTKPNPSFERTCHSRLRRLRHAAQLKRLLNEAHHRVSSYLSHYHVGDEDPGWIDAVVDYVFNAKEPVVLPSGRNHSVAGAATAAESKPARPFSKYTARSATIG